ncbi:ribosomal-processing cysteine protease Prp [Erysipelothrix urinaevulpis]|uniref:ribosomal-processing cysteine protease Prp n=1 Tax=Erysipelothrix urinaevulpis TaxID=2683717 RepID=UPI001357CB46|nr:ribosomal-processing cysteine protease Prp [Erysipelothrix urinaevulpis]
MIKVEVVCQKNNNISQIKVWDHAESGEYGFDLVCAGVSSIMIGALNALNELDYPFNYEISPRPLILIEWSGSDEKQEMMKIIYYQLKTIEEQYGNYIKIIEKEEFQ